MMLSTLHRAGHMSGRTGIGVLINDMIHTEPSLGFDQIEDMAAVLDAAPIDMARVPRAALFLGRKAFRRYRNRGGSRTGISPDRFIGAHVAAAALLTQDGRHYRPGFPTVTLVTLPARSADR